VAVAAIGWAVRDRVAQKDEFERARIRREREQARNKEAKQAQLAAQIDVILKDTDRLVKTQEWPAALDAAKRAEAAVNSGDADALTRRRVEKALAELTLVQRLDEARMLRTQFWQSGYRIPDGHRAYQRAFAEAGISIEGVSVEEAAAELRQHPMILDELSVGLTEWARTAFKGDAPGAHPKYHLLDVADTIDPDPLRQRVRAFVRNRPSGEEYYRIRRELVTSARADLRRQPTSTIRLIAGLYLFPHAYTSGIDELIGLLEEAQRLHPQDFWINFQLALVLDKSEPPQLARALISYHVAHAIRPDNLAVLSWLCAAFERQENWREALIWRRKSLELAPDDPDFHFKLGNTLVRLGEDLKARRQSAEATEAFNSAISEFGLFFKGNEDTLAFPVRWNIGLTYFKIGKFDESLRVMREIVQLEPSGDAPPHAAPHYMIGQILARTGKLCDAIAEYRSAIEIQPNYADVYPNLVWLLTTAEDVNLRNPTEAVELARKAVELEPENANHWDNLGVAQYRAGDWRAALDALEKARKMRGGKDPYHRFFLAMTYWQLGKRDEAVKTYDEAVAWLDGGKRPVDQYRFGDEAKELISPEATKPEPRPEKGQKPELPAGAGAQDPEQPLNSPQQSEAAAGQQPEP